LFKKSLIEGGHQLLYNTGFVGILKEKCVYGDYNPLAENML
jgi:hypothetical protein